MLIGLVGNIGSGKDTIADYLYSMNSFSRLSFASPLKDAVAHLFGWNRDKLEGRDIQSRVWRERVDPYWNITPRHALQKVGTDLFRDNFDNEFWIKSLILKLREMNFKGVKNIVITDCRFRNEVEAIKKEGGIIIGITRKQEKIDSHPSEKEIKDILDSDLIDYHLKNVGTISDLYIAFEEIYKKL